MFQQAIWNTTEYFKIDNDNRKAYTDLIQNLEEPKFVSIRSFPFKVSMLYIDMVDEFPKTHLINIQNNPIY